jgi:hypothetical protein
MKTQELFENMFRLKGGYYQLPYSHITPRDRGLATFFNSSNGLQTLFMRWETQEPKWTP